MRSQEYRIGAFSALPLSLLLVVTFIAPLLLIVALSFMPPHTFSALHLPTFANYETLLLDGYYKSLLWSLALAFVTTAILFIVCYPLAFAMAKIFRRFTLVLTIGVVALLFVSENTRLFGWVLTLMKGGMILGPLEKWFGITLDSPLYNIPIIIFGLVYVYLPFMLFPLMMGIAMVPDEVRQAASDLGASRTRVLLEIDLPLAVPGIMVGCMLTFVLSAGAVIETKLLGGAAVVVAGMDIETAFTYAQNWPRGSAIAVVLIAIVASIAFIVLSRIDIDRIMGHES